VEPEADVRLLRHGPDTNLGYSVSGGHGLQRPRGKEEHGKCCIISIASEISVIG